MKRKRERNSFKEFDWVTVHYTDRNSNSVDKIYGASRWTRHWEYMDDTIGSNQSDFNPCYHYKFIQPGKPVDSFAVEVDPGVYEFYSTNVGGIQANDILGALRSYDFGIDDWLEDFGANAEDHFLTPVQDKNSLLNFIIELIELCEGNLKVAKVLSKKLETAVETFWRIFKKTGNYWVAWNFAWKPTINDVHSFFTTLQRAEKRVKWLRAVNHKNIKVHYREKPRPFSGVLSLDCTWFDRVPGGDPAVLPKPANLSAELTFDCEIGLSAWAWVRFDIPDQFLFSFEDAIGMTALMMQGVYNPAKIAWEAVPFSWLVEWFTNKRAELLKEKASLAQLIFPNSTILGTGYTIHLMKCTGESTVLSDGPTGIIRYGVGSYFLDLFDRRPGLPTGDPGFRFQALSAWQTSILACIGVNKKHTGKRRR